MAIYETGILLDGTILIQKRYYDESSMMQEDLRNNLLRAVYSFAKEAFNTEFESVSSSSYSIVIVSEKFDESVLTKKSKIDQEKTQIHTLIMFSIIENDTDEKIVKNCMNNILEQFLNRFSINDILTKTSKHFAEFSKRFDKVFKDLVLNCEDRLKVALDF